MTDEHTSGAPERTDSTRTPSFSLTSEHPAERAWIPPPHSADDRRSRSGDDESLPSGGPVHSGSVDRDSGSGDDPSGSAEGSDSAVGTSSTAAGERRRRRRGSRGGRRRRGRGGDRPPAPLGDGDAPDSAEREPLDPPSSSRATSREDDSSSDDGSSRADSGARTDAPGDGSKRRRRRRGRGRGRGRAASDGATAGGRPGIERPAERPDVESGEPEGERWRENELLETERSREQRTAPSRPDTARREGGSRRRRRRGGRGRRRNREGEGAPERELGVPVEIEAIPGEEDDLPELPELPSDAVALPREDLEVAEAPRRDEDLERDEGGRGRGRRRRRRGERAAAEAGEERTAAPQRPGKRNLILVNAADPEEQRVAVVEDGRIVDFQMTVRTENSVVNDIYRGRVVNLETAIGAAFVEFGQGKNGFLHTSDVLPAYGEKDWSLDKLLTTSLDPEDWEAGSEKPEGSEGAEGPESEGHGEAHAEESESEGGAGPSARKDRGGRRRRAERGKRFRARPRLPITDLLKKGQMVAVQVTKDAIGDKGPTLTTYISIPGRYLVLMPSMSRTGVSRKIEDERERKRLKKILEQLDVPPGMGVIVRTAGVGRTQEDLRRDLDYLTSAWESFSRRLKAGHGPAPLYQESDIAIRTVRDLFTSETEAVIVDDPEVHRQILEFTRRLMPEAEERVKLHDAAKPLFQSYGIEPDFERLFARRIELPSGGSIVFDQAEALVAIDVNSGRTRGGGHDFEDVALKTNLEAAPEIARQIRLRDLGGILVVDFIDMMKQANIRRVEKAFKDSLDQDRARSKIGRISQFGLLELTRQRLGPGIARKVFTTCPRCRGTGRMRSVESRAAAILRRLGSAMTLKGFAAVEVKAHPEVIGYLKRSCSDLIKAFEYRFEKQIRLIDSPEQHEDSVLRYLRADGREVRPGGRRKR
jgi:ribonuclease E